MAEKKVKTRIIQKHDTKENWDKATGFTPEKGEIIIYDDVLDGSGAPRIKIGDGSNKVSDLPFILKGDIDSLVSNIEGLSDVQDDLAADIAAIEDEVDELMEKLNNAIKVFSGDADPNSFTIANAADGDVYLRMER